MILNVVVSTIPGIDADAPDTPVIFGVYQCADLARQVAEAISDRPRALVAVLELDYVIPSIRRQLQELKQ